MKINEFGKGGEKAAGSKCQQIDYNRLIKEVMEHSNVLEKNKRTKQGLVKGRSSATLQPAWTKTQQQVDREEEREADELIDFMQDFDYKEFEEDVEVKMILHDIKSRIEELGGQGVSGGSQEESGSLRAPAQGTAEEKRRNREQNLRRAISAHQMDQVEALRPKTGAVKKIGPSSKVNKERLPFKAIVRPAVGVSNRRM
jgi:hypothetical protein